MVLASRAEVSPHPAVSPKLLKVISKVEGCRRFMSEFIVDDLEKQICDEASKGEFGYTGKFTLRASNVIDGKDYSVIVIDPQNYEGDHMKIIYSLSALRDGNPYVCKYFGSWREEGLFFVQTEKSENLFTDVQPTNEHLSKLVKDVLMAIEYCHRKGISGLSISLSSIFLSETNHFKLKSFEN